MKVAYLLGSLNRGGAETLILDVFKNADIAKFAIVGIHRHGGEYVNDFYATGRTIYHLRQKRLGLIRYLIELRHILKGENVTIAHAQMAIDAIYAKLAAWGLPIKVVLTFHGFDIGAGWITKLRNRLAIRCADKICFVSEYEKQYYEQRYSISNKGAVVYNGIDFAKVEQCSMHDAQCTKNYGVKLCCVGSFGSTRSQIVICKALGLLKEKGIEPIFYFIGGKRKSEPYLYDECFEYCQKMGLNQVHFLGVRNDVYELETTMDAFIYSTVKDTFGIAVVEAMVAGLPVIVNDWAVMKEITKDGQWATLFKTEDVEDCADKIEYLLNYLEERKARAQIVANVVRKEYSIEKHIERLNEIYNSL